MPERDRFAAVVEGGFFEEPIAFAQNTRDEVRLIGGDGQSVGALAAEPGMKQQNYVAFSGDIARTLNARHDSSPCADRGMDVVLTSGTVHSRVGFGFDSGKEVPGSMAVRRLTPV